MRVLIVTGIWPPDVGGPATHAPELADALRARGHDVAVVTTADATPDPRLYRVRAVRRNALRYPNVVAQIAAAARAADVVYVASMLHRAALASALVRRVFVVKLPSDPAFERARRRALFDGTLDEFQHAHGPVPAALRAVRTVALRRAAHVLCPSAYLRDLVVGWGIAPERVTVVPNPAPAAVDATDGAVRDRGSLVFAGRLNAQKSIATLLAAVARVDEATLTIAGDGPERAALERRANAPPLAGRVRFVGTRPRESVLELFRNADAAVLSSAWENFPHTLVEALAVGTPVIATDVGGVSEVVEDGRNGLLVRPGDADAFADALRRYLADAELRAQLRANAAASVERFAPDRVYARLEEILVEAAQS